jgi:hypothetical protein
MGARLWGSGAVGAARSVCVGYGLWLTERGYSPWTAAHRLWEFDLLSRWLECQQLSPVG